ncbi:MAG: hypothetical protein EHM61_16950 [Acidobacteria bacterium]|nr:MAG: hypothetical protein EHM61_16950 [Acidobacteriota bacterium]
MRLYLALLLSLCCLFPTVLGAGKQIEESSPRMAIAVSTVSGVRYYQMPGTSEPGGEMIFTPFSGSSMRVRLNFWMENSGRLVLRFSTIQYAGNDWPRDESFWTRVAEFRMQPRIGETLYDSRLADLGVRRVVVVSALSPVPNPPRVWTSVRAIEVIDIEEELRGRYKLTFKNSSSEVIQGLAFRNFEGVGTSIGLRDEARAVSAGGTFTHRTSCDPVRNCELHVTAALTVRGNCSGEAEPCRLLMAQWRGRQIAARLILPVLEKAKSENAFDASQLARLLLEVNVTDSLATAATDILRSTRARATSREQVEHRLLIGANELVNSLKERLVERGNTVPPVSRNQDVLLEELIDKCRRVVSNASPTGKGRLRL